MYNLVLIKEEDEWKTTFSTWYGHIAHTMMPFKLCNALAVFQHLMNDIFGDMLDQLIAIYVDDILIYSTTPQQDSKPHLYANLEKNAFDLMEVEFWGYLISP